MIFIKLVHSIINFFTTNLLWQEGWLLVFITAIITFLGLFLWRPLISLAVIFFIFCLFFFRNPQREPAQIGENILICPADGKIVQVQYDPQGRFEGYHHIISIFLSPFNVHVNWIPVDGIIEKIAYHKGQFVPAFLPKSSHFNERNDIHIRTQLGKTLIVRQIAGTIARTICWWVKPGEQVHSGQKYGMIKFGSRVDLLLSQNVEILVKVGDKVYGGHTVVGRWMS